MADVIPCKKCDYPEAIHTDLKLLGDEELSDEELWKKHLQLAKCLFGRKRGFEPKISRRGD